MNKQEIEKFIDETRRYIAPKFLRQVNSKLWLEPEDVTILKRKLSRALGYLEKILTPSSRLDIEQANGIPDVV